MSPFNEYGNIQDPITKGAREAIYDTCQLELKRLLGSGASIVELKAVARDLADTVNVACAEIILEEQVRKRQGYSRG